MGFQEKYIYCPHMRVCGQSADGELIGMSWLSQLLSFWQKKWEMWPNRLKRSYPVYLLTEIAFYLLRCKTNISFVLFILLNSFFGQLKLPEINEQEQQLPWQRMFFFLLIMTICLIFGIRLRIVNQNCVRAVETKEP